MIRRLSTLLSIQNLLMLAILVLNGLAAESLAPDDVQIQLWSVALLAGILGIVLGQLRAPDSLSHLIAIGTGIFGAIALAAFRLSDEASRGSFWDRFVGVSTEIKDWYIGTGAEADTDTLLVIILLQMVVWLMSYLASWALVRRGWLTVALVLPGIVVASARMLGTDPPVYLLEIYMIVAVMLLARSTYVARSRAGRESGTMAHRRYGWYSLVTGAVVGILVVTLGLSTPAGFSQDVVRPLANYAGETYLDAQEGTSDWVADQLDLSGTRRGDVENFPRYTAFDDAFSVGGDLNLSDQPEVLVRADGPAPYLVAQSYDSYTGRGWESTVEDTFEAAGPDGVRYSPELTFRPGQKVPYSSSISDDRSPMSMEVTPLTPSGDTMFTTGMYSTSDQRASVRMSWEQLENQAFPLQEMDLSTIPPDLTGIVSLLLQAEELTVEGDGDLLYPSAPDAREQMESVRTQLAERFIDVSWTVAGDGGVGQMFVTGQLPIYDDNVRVSRAADGPASDTYTVTSLLTNATEQDLQSAPTGYPDWVQERYLELPSSVTDRTVRLTRELATGVSNPYDQAKIIERFLRAHISYDLNVGVPPEDADIVDYVLFELKRGYCEYYASAMTVMMRILGIPAKTVVGYFPADYDQEAGGYLYRQENAHAWTEVYFPGYGWIPFEPTAARPASSLESSQTAPTPTPTPVPTVAPESRQATPPIETSPIVEQDVQDGPDVVPETTPESDGISWPAIAMVMAAAFAIGTLAIWFAFTRSPATESRSLFGALLRWGRAGGVRSDPASTPREYARSFGRKYPDLAGDASEIVDVYERQRYGGTAPGSSSIRRATHALARLKRQLLRRVLRLRR